MFQIRSSIALNERLTAECWRVILEASPIASEIKPGQFINVKIGDSHYPLFKRPFSVVRCVSLGEDILGLEVIYRVVGLGTRLMSDLKRGDEVDVIGPLGHGFEFDRDKKAHVLVAGGIGSTCLFMLAEKISETISKDRLQLNILLGSPTKESLLLEKEFRSLNANVLISTDDGTYGYPGLVTAMLRDSLDKGSVSTDCTIYACGPELMYRELASICQLYSIPAQVSIERHMMCGIGACLICVCKVDKNIACKRRDVKSSHMQFIPEEAFGYALTCKDEPVFHIDEVIFDE